MADEPWNQLHQVLHAMKTDFMEKNIQHVFHCNQWVFPKNGENGSIQKAQVDSSWFFSARNGIEFLGEQCTIIGHGFNSVGMLSG